MVARIAVSCQQQSYLARQWNYKVAPFGRRLSMIRMSGWMGTYFCSIFRPSKTATQSGDWHAHEWRMDWDVLGKGHRWENFLMGWQSTGDSMHATHLSFKSKEDAIHFAEKQGYEYFVQEFNERKFVPKSYANNFVHSPKKLKVVRTK